MKKLKGIDKIVFLFNSFIAVILLLSYLLPYASPKRFASISVLSLIVPLFIILNVLFYSILVTQDKKAIAFVFTGFAFGI